MWRDVWVGVLTVTAIAFGSDAGAAEITKQDWLAAVARAQVPSEVLFGLSLQESGTTMSGRREYAPWPWTLNVSEEGRYFDSQDEALSVLERELKAGNRRIAVGMFQIHVRYNGHRVADVRTLLDPLVNLRVAAEVLADCAATYEKLEDRLSCYYSGDVDEAGEDYARNVLARAARYGAPFIIAGQSSLPMRKPTGHPHRALPPQDAVGAETDFESVLGRLKRSHGRDARVIVLAASNGEQP